MPLCAFCSGNLPSAEVTCFFVRLASKGERETFCAFQFSSSKEAFHGGAHVSCMLKSKWVAKIPPQELLKLT